MSPSLRALAARGQAHRYRKGALLIQEGELGDTLFIVLEGRLRAFGADVRGREITYGLYGPGEYLGEMSLDGGPRSASVEAAEPSLCVLVTRQALLQHIAEQPEFALELLSRVIRRARAATLSTKQLALSDVYSRLLGLLREIGRQAADDLLIDERPTHQEIASRIGCSREMVSRLVKDLERGGYLVPEGRGWRVSRRMPARW